MHIDYKLIGERIQKARKSRGLTQEIMAEKLNVSIGYVSQVERGITKISLDLLGAISTILNCDVATFVSESALHSQEYLESELISEIRKLDQKKKEIHPRCHPNGKRDFVNPLFLCKNVNNCFQTNAKSRP